MKTLFQIKYHIVHLWKDRENNAYVICKLNKGDYFLSLEEYENKSKNTYVKVLTQFGSGYIRINYLK